MLSRLLGSVMEQVLQKVLKKNRSFCSLSIFGLLHKVACSTSRFRLVIGALCPHTSGLPMFSHCVIASEPSLFYLGLRSLSQLRQFSIQAYIPLPRRLIASARPHHRFYTGRSIPVYSLFSFWYDAYTSNLFLCSWIRNG